MRYLISFLLFFLGATNLVAEERLELVMVEQSGCAWCLRWNQEIAPIYPKTEIGQAAPLRRIDLHDPLPQEVTFSRPFVFTPTFVVIEDGQEIFRIEGYPGEDFFWAILESRMQEQGLFEPSASG